MIASAAPVVTPALQEKGNAYRKKNAVYFELVFHHGTRCYLSAQVQGTNGFIIRCIFFPFLVLLCPGGMDDSYIYRPFWEVRCGVNLVTSFGSCVIEPGVIEDYSYKEVSCRLYTKNKRKDRKNNAGSDGCTGFRSGEKGKEDVAVMTVPPGL